MQKSFLKFMVFELVERVMRFRLLLDEQQDTLRDRAPLLAQKLFQEAEGLEEQLLSHKVALNGLFSEGASPKPLPPDFEAGLDLIYARLQGLSRTLLQINPVPVASETWLFLKEALPPELLKEAGEQTVFLSAEGAEQVQSPLDLPAVLLDALSVLQKNNPLGWLGLMQSYSRHLVGQTPALTALKADLQKTERKKSALPVDEAMAKNLLQHAVHLRVLGPAYYFYALSQALFHQDETFLHWTEPALFFGLNHQNFTHKSLVILHEACEKSRQEPTASGKASPAPWPEETLARLFRAVEKAVPARHAFQEKQMERAVQLQERLAQGVLLSSTPLYPVEEVARHYEQTRERADFSIYAPLSMLTEYPHTPREMVNAGWLHKIERSPVWLYTILNEENKAGFEKVADVLRYQDHLLRKSIEVSEVHRVLMCAP